jgi:hypothetical protein
LLFGLLTELLLDRLELVAQFVDTLVHQVTIDGNRLPSDGLEVVVVGRELSRSRLDAECVLVRLGVGLKDVELLLEVSLGHLRCALCGWCSRLTHRSG